MHASNATRRRRPEGASKLEWAVLALVALIGGLGLGLEYHTLQGSRQRERAESARLARLQRATEEKTRALRRLETPLGREMRVRELGGLKPGELPLPPPRAEPEVAPLRP